MPLAGGFSGPQWGFSAHIGGHDPARADQVAKMMVSTGATVIRDDAAWGWHQPTNSPVNWQGSYVETTMRAARDNGLKVVVQSGFAPFWANGGNGNDKVGPTSVYYQAFADYVRSLCEYLETNWPGVCMAVEYWNEPNIYFLTNPATGVQGDATYYTTLAKRAWDTVRGINPVATNAAPNIELWAGSVAGNGGGYPDAYDWILECIAQGLIGRYDAFSIHPYWWALNQDPAFIAAVETNGLGPSNTFWTAHANDAQGRRFIDVLANAGDATSRIHSTEWGIPTHVSGTGEPVGPTPGQGGERSMSEEAVAETFRLIWPKMRDGAGPRAGHLFYYTEIDDNSFVYSGEIEHYGAYRSDDSPKPLVAAMQNAAQGGAGSMAPNVFGATTIGVGWAPQSPDFRNARKYTATPAAGRVTDIYIYCRGAANSNPVRATVNRDASGSPGEIAGLSDEVTIAVNQAAGWQRFVFSTPVDYSPSEVLHLGSHCGGIATPQWEVARTTSGVNDAFYAPDVYTDGTGTGGWTAHNQVDSVYAVGEQVVSGPVGPNGSPIRDSFNRADEAELGTNGWYTPVGDVGLPLVGGQVAGRTGAVTEFGSGAALDDFNRADEGPPPSVSWTADPWASGLSAPRVVSNELVPNSGFGAYSSAYWNPRTFADNWDCSMRITNPGTLTSYLAMSTELGVGADGYELAYRAGAFQRQLRLSRITDRNATTLYDYFTTLSAGDEIGMRKQGNTISVYRRPVNTTVWEWLFNVVDATYTDPSWHMHVSLAGTTRLDNLGVSEYTATVNYGYSKNQAEIGPQLELFATVVAKPGTGNFVILATEVAPLTGYILHWDDLAGTDTIKLVKGVSDVDTILATYNQEVSAGDRIALVVTATHVQAWRAPAGGAWVLLGSVADTQLRSPYTRPGIYAGGPSLRLDDIGWGTLSAGTSTIYRAAALDDAWPGGGLLRDKRLSDLVGGVVIRTKTLADSYPTSP